MKIVVTGAGGWLGQVICRLAQEAGHEVIALGRAQSRPGPWRHHIVCDLTEDTALAAASDPAIKGGEVVIHCAGYAHRPIETAAEILSFDAVNREGTRRMVEICRRASIPRLVYLSSIAFYNWSLGSDFDETGPVIRSTAYAASKLDGETLVRKSDLDWRVLRMGTVYGPGDKANFFKLAGAISRGRFYQPGAGGARKSVLPVQLAAELILEMSTMSQVAAPLLNLALPDSPSLAEICRAFSRELDCREVRKMPLPVLKVLARLGDGLRLLSPGFPLTSTSLGKLTTSTTVDVSRMKMVFRNRDWRDFDWWLKESGEYYRAVVIGAS